MTKFVNLHGHTCHSHLDAIIRIPELFARAKELGQKAVAITDHGVMAGCWEAFQEYKKTGIKYIPGNEAYYCEDLSQPKSKRGHLILLAKNETGYRNLLKLTAEGYKHHTIVFGREVPRIDAAMLRECSEGLVATSACMSSLIADGIFNDESSDNAERIALELKDIFGSDFYIELQPHDLHFIRKNKETNEIKRYSQIELNRGIREIALRHDIKMIATCDSHYLTPDDEPYHDMIQAMSSKKSLEDLNRKRYAYRDPCDTCEGHGKYPIDSKTKCPDCQGSGSSNPVSCPEYYLKSEEEIRNFFTDHFDSDFAEELINNTSVIADECENPDYIEPTGHRLPIYDLSHIKQSKDYEEFRSWLSEDPKRENWPIDTAYVKFSCKKSFDLYCKKMPNKAKRVYWDRLVKEIDVLDKLHLSSYMLIVADFIGWSRENDIYIGPGRGSACSSLVAYFLKIHEMDPVKYGLVFERFHNLLKKSMADIDVDFAPSGKKLAYEYVKEKYGEDYVCYISNISRITPKVAIKDVCRSMQIGGDKSTAFSLANQVTADIPDTYVDKKGNKKKVKTYADALESSKKLRSFTDKYPEVQSYCEKIIGLPRNFSVHAGGVVISDVPLSTYAPMRMDKDRTYVIQYDKEACEDVGLVKMDFLGLETLDILKETFESAKKIGVKLPKYNKIPMGDERAYRVIQSGKVLGLFQLEGSTIQPLCKPFKPRSIEDLALINALGRPSCSPQERKEFINRRFGKTKVKYYHPVLEKNTKSTLGLAVYDEDLLRIGQDVAGWDLAQADLLRKLTKKKDPEFAASLKNDFVDGCINHSKISKQEALLIWNDVVVPFATYAFNKSHAVAYSTLGYRCAFYKAYAPAPFLNAILNSKTRSNSPDKDSNVDSVKRDMRSFGISILPCDINKSKEYYTVIDNKTIVTGFGAVKGVGEKALEDIVRNQPYSSFEDFLHRTKSACVNKKVVQALAKAGAFDSFGLSRKFAHDYYGKIRTKLLKYVKGLDADMFSDEERAKPKEGYLANFNHEFDEELQELDWVLRDKMIFEKEVLGQYVSGEIDVLYPGFFKHGDYNPSFLQVNSMQKDTVIKAEGVVTGVKELKYRRGKNAGAEFGKLTFENAQGETIDVTVWHTDYSKMKDILAQGHTPIRGLFKVNEWEGQKTLILGKLEAIYREKESK